MKNTEDTEKGNQLSEEDWKMKTAVRTPTRTVTAKATVGRGDVSPKFCRSRRRELLEIVLAIIAFLHYHVIVLLDICRKQHK